MEIIIIDIIIMENKSKKRRDRHISFIHILWYELIRTMAHISMFLCFRLIHYGRKNIPSKGPLLIVSNHQSFLDPPAVGCGFWRRVNYLARKTLFKFKPFGWLIDSLDAIPLDQEGIGFTGIKETLRRLKNNEGVVIFPEGARSEDGRLTPFKKGYITLAFRSKATIVPTVVVGAFDVLSRKDKYPHFFKKPVIVEYGTPMLYEDYSLLSEEEVHQNVEREITRMFNERMAKRQPVKKRNA